MGTSFLDLPPELRNSVYHLALSERDPITISFDERFRVLPGSPYMIQQSRASPDVPGIINTCREVRDEALPVYYGSCRFRIVLPDDGYTRLYFWLEQRGYLPCKYIRHLEFAFRITASTERLTSVFPPPNASITACKGNSGGAAVIFAGVLIAECTCRSFDQLQPYRDRKTPDGETVCAMVQAFEYYLVKQLLGSGRQDRGACSRCRKPLLYK